MTAIGQVWSLISDYQAKHHGFRPEALTLPADLYLSAFRELSAMTARAVGGNAEPSDSPPEGGYVLYGVKMVPIEGKQIGAEVGALFAKLFEPSDDTPTP